MHYQVPFAAEPVRLLIGGFSALFLLAIYGSWLPRAIRQLRSLPGMSPASAIVSAAIAVIPLLIGIGPLLLLIALIRNPMTYVTDAGVQKENTFSATAVNLNWADIVRVECRTGRTGKVNTILIFAGDGRKIGFRNASADFAPIRELLVQRLGRGVARSCAR